MRKKSNAEYFFRSCLPFLCTASMTIASRCLQQRNIQLLLALEILNLAFSHVITTKTISATLSSNKMTRYHSAFFVFLFLVLFFSFSHAAPHTPTFWLMIFLCTVFFQFFIALNVSNSPEINNDQLFILFAVYFYSCDCCSSLTYATFIPWSLLTVLTS